MKIHNKPMLFAAVFLLSIFFGVMFAESISAQEFDDNWHRFRGPDGNGVAVNATPPLEWGQDSDNLKWKVAIPGKAGSSPIVWEDKIFVMTAVDTGKDKDGNEVEVAEEAPRPRGGRGGRRGGRRGRRAVPKTVHEFWVMCVNREDGKTLWKTKVNEAVPHEGKHSTNTFCSGSPVTNGQHVYANFGSFGLYCLDMNGDVVWDRSFGKMQTRNSFGEGSSPALYKDKLIMIWDHEGDSFVETMSAKDGKTIWKVDREEKSGWTTPRVVEHNDRVQVIINATTVRSYDLADGSVVWECGGQTGNPIPVPFIVDDMAICMTGFRSSACYAIPLDSSGDISDSDKIAWNTRNVGPYVPTGVAYKGTVYATKGSQPVIAALDSKSGETVFDSTRLEGIRTLYSSMVAANDHIFVTGRNGTTLVLKHGKNFDLVGTNELGEPVDATPALVGNQVIIRGESNLYCFEN